ncbi:MAG: hypothetical protein J5802_07720 [Butyrivibrio sp.]|nr:hypothetical protein [Butyrivibrio sp.]
MIVDKNLLEMAKVYRMSKFRIIRYIYIPEFFARLKGKNSGGKKDLR